MTRVSQKQHFHRKHFFPWLYICLGSLQGTHKNYRSLKLPSLSLTWAPPFMVNMFYLNIFDRWPLTQATWEFFGPNRERNSSFGEAGPWGKVLAERIPYPHNSCLKLLNKREKGFRSHWRGSGLGISIFPTLPNLKYSSRCSAELLQIKEVIGVCAYIYYNIWEFIKEMMSTRVIENI